MALVCRTAGHLPALALLASTLVLGRTLPLVAQVFPAAQLETIDKVSIDVADSSTRTHLERVRALLADEQWDDAIEILRQVMENHGGKMFEVSQGHYIGLRDYCQLRLAALPEPALELYRQRVDPQARQLYEQGVQRRDREALRRVVRDYFASSYGDDALFALGELALGEGNYPLARSHWGKLRETPPAVLNAATFEQVRHAATLAAEDAQLLDRWYMAINTGDKPLYVLHPSQMRPDDVEQRLVRILTTHGVLPTRLAYPQTDLNLADIRARLVLASILEGATSRARGELAAFSQLHPDAEGKLGGRSGRYVDLLSALIESSTQWPEAAVSPKWHTFAGNTRRNFRTEERLDLGDLVWKQPLERNTASDFRVAGSFGYSPRRVAEDADGLLSYHPIVAGDLVLVAAQDKILGYDLETGKPGWGSSDGVIFKLNDAAVRSHVRHSQLGAPRFTLSVHENLLFARIGSPVTSSVVDATFNPPAAELLWFDLDRQAALMQRVKPDNEKWSFDGVPLCDGRNVYVAMRRSDVGSKPHAHVACFEVETGKLRWRKYICAADAPGRGQMDEITHNLLTLEKGVLYFNTNLGAVAAVSTEDGEVLWISRYPRSGSTELSRTSSHLYRDLNPCVYHQGRLYVAPSDSARIFAFDALSGERLWATAEGHPEDAVHLLGVLGNTLVASGDRLWAFDIENQLKAVAVFPENKTPRGHGRGVLMGDEVIWPTRERLYHFRLESQPTADGLPGQQRRVCWWHNTQIDNLVQYSPMGGNLVVAKDRLLVAASDMLYAFQRYSE